MTCNYLLKSPFGSREFCNNNKKKTRGDLLKSIQSDGAICLAVSFSKRAGIPSGP